MREVGSNRLSVLMVGPSRDARGGITGVVNSYFEAGLNRLCHITYIGTTSSGGYLSKARAAMKALSHFSKLLPQYDVVHIHLGGGISVDRKQLFMNKAKSVGKPVVVHVHVNLERLFKGHGNAYKQRYYRFIGDADKVIVLSRQEQQFYIDNALCSPDKLMVFNNAVEIPKVNDFDSHSDKVIFLGHMTYLKAPDILIQAIPQITAFAPRMQFIFAGNGNSSPYQKLAQSLGVLPCCHFIGWVDRSKKEQMFNDSYAFVQSSRDEAMSMSLLEAMAHGLPVVATDVGATASIVRNGSEGFLIPPSDSGILADRVINLIKNRDLAQKMSRAARSRIVEDFNIQTQISKLIGLYMYLSNNRQNKND
jgi:glycosyltransferase involved in cell wall biosynthesis